MKDAFCENHICPFVCDFSEYRRGEGRTFLRDVNDIFFLTVTSYDALKVKIALLKSVY
jgi:hypothetical protein